MAKKNICRTTSERVRNVIGYTFPKVHDTKKCKYAYVDFYAYDASRDEMRRVKKFFTKIPTLRLRRIAVEDYILKMASALAKGFRPWDSEKRSPAFEKVESALSKYEDYLKRFDRRKTTLSYQSRVNILREYLGTAEGGITFCYEFTPAFCQGFIDWLLGVRHVSARTANNYLGWLCSFCEFMLRRGYISSNPTKDLKKLRTSRKIREALSKDELKRAFVYLREHDRYFLLACLFEYFTFIRPSELINIRIGDISVKEQSVFVSETFSKNRRNGKVGLNRDLILLMVELGCLEYPSDHYLFGKGILPNVRKGNPDQFNKRWAVIRRHLGFGSSLQFYSFKDSGIRDLANAKGIVVARDQARHSDISTTNKYLSGADLRAPSEAKEFGLDF